MTLRRSRTRQILAAKTQPRFRCHVAAVGVKRCGQKVRVISSRPAGRKVCPRFIKTAWRSGRHFWSSDWPAASPIPSLANDVTSVFGSKGIPDVGVRVRLNLVPSEVGIAPVFDSVRTIVEHKIAGRRPDHEYCVTFTGTRKGGCDPHGPR